MDDRAPGTNPTAGDKNTLDALLALCGVRCPRDRIDLTGCPLSEVRKLKPAALLEWLDRLSGEERDYLTLYQQCGLVIDHESRFLGGARTMPLPVRSAASGESTRAAMAAGADRVEPLHDETFNEAFCRRFRCPSEDYNREVFKRAAYPVARWWARCGGYRSDRFVLDRALVDYCGTLRSLREIDGELEEYAGYRENRKFLRRALRLRISARRFRRLAAECLA